MRQPSRPSSHLFHPLDSILGTPAGIRILRVLSAAEHSLSRTTLAAEAGLGHAGTGLALERLVRAGVVVPTGDSGRPHYQLADHPVSQAVRKLFGKEAARVDDFLREIGEAAEGLDPEPVAVWLVAASDEEVATVADGVAITVVYAEDEKPGLKSFRRECEKAGDRYGYSVTVAGVVEGEASGMTSPGAVLVGGKGKEE